MHGSHLQAWKPEHGHIPPGLHPLDVLLPLWLEAFDGVVEHEHVASEGRRFPVEFDPFCADATKAETFRVQVLQRRVPYAAKIHRLLDTLSLLSIFEFLAMFFLDISAALKDLIAILNQQSTSSLEKSAARHPDVDGDKNEKTSPVICVHTSFYAATFPESVSKMPGGENNITTILCKNFIIYQWTTEWGHQNFHQDFLFETNIFEIETEAFFDTKIIEIDTDTLKRKEIILDTDTTFPNLYGES